MLIKIDTYFLFSLGIAQEKNDPIFGPKICESGYTHDKDEVHDCIINRYVITAVLHSVGMKHRSLASASENACAGSGERFLFERTVVQGHLKLPFRKCCIFFVFYLLLCVAI